MTHRAKQPTQPTQKQQTGNFWPRTMLYEGLGIVLVAVAIFLLLTLLTFHPDDPSFNQTGSEVVRNGAGLFGAYLADILLQILGYAAGGLVVLFGVSGIQHDQAACGIAQNQAAWSCCSVSPGYSFFASPVLPFGKR
jgi:hypothetical protein